MSKLTDNSIFDENVCVPTRLNPTRIPTVAHILQDSTVRSIKWGHFFSEEIECQGNSHVQVLASLLAALLMSLPISSSPELHILEIPSTKIRWLRRYGQLVRCGVLIT